MCRVETIQEQLCTSAGREVEEEQEAECDDPVEDQGERSRGCEAGGARGDEGLLRRRLERMTSERQPKDSLIWEMYDRIAILITPYIGIS